MPPMRIPLIDVELNSPTRGSLAWYAAVGAMGASGLVEWPLAALIAAGHLISENSRNPEVSAAAEGVESTVG